MSALYNGYDDLGNGEGYGYGKARIGEIRKMVPHLLKAIRLVENQYNKVYPNLSETSREEVIENIVSRRLDVIDLISKACDELYILDTIICELAYGKK